MLKVQSRAMAVGPVGQPEILRGNVCQGVTLAFTVVPVSVLRLTHLTSRGPSHRQIQLAQPTRTCSPCMYDICSTIGVLLVRVFA